MDELYRAYSTVRTAFTIAADSQRGWNRLFAAKNNSTEKHSHRRVGTLGNLHLHWNVIELNFDYKIYKVSLDWQRPSRPGFTDLQVISRICLN